MAKRLAYPVTLLNGEQIHVRTLTHGQLKVVREFSNDDESIGYTLGFGIVDDAGEREFTKTAEESPKQFGGRVMAAMEAADIGLDIQNQIVGVIFKLSSDATEKQLEALVKN